VVFANNGSTLRLSTILVGIYHGYTVGGYSADPVTMKY